MSREGQRESNNLYYTVFKGSFRRRVPEGTEGALTRTNKNGKEVHEMEAPNLIGYIEKIWFEDSDFGKQLKIQLDKNEKGQTPILSFGVESKDGRDVMKKLPNVDFKREVKIYPYSFTDEKGQDRSGISILQPGAGGEFTIKVTNHFFYDKNKVQLHGFPTIAWDEATESQRKIYKIQRDDFLVKYLEEKTIPRVEKAREAIDPLDEAFPTKEGAYPKEDINPDDIPF